MDKITTRLREINNILKEKEQEIKSENVMNKNFLKLLKKKSSDWNAWYPTEQLELNPQIYMS